MSNSPLFRCQCWWKCFCQHVLQEMMKFVIWHLRLTIISLQFHIFITQNKRNCSLHKWRPSQCTFNNWDIIHIEYIPQKVMEINAHNNIFEHYSCISHNYLSYIIVWICFISHIIERQIYVSKLRYVTLFTHAHENTKYCQDEI